MNKKGDLSIVILVMGVLAVCVFALLSFYLNDLKSRENAFSGLDKIQEANLDMEKYLSGDLQGIEIKQLGKMRIIEKEKISSPWFGEGVVLFRIRYFLE